jgi:alkylation response protein AidB-like acyl-CoA dehydrogenase
MVTFSFERGTAFVSELLKSMVLVDELVELARKTPWDGGPGGGSAWDDGSVRRELVAIAAELDALWALTRRNVSQAARAGNAGVGGSVFKLRYHETRIRMGDLAMRLLGRAGLAIGPHVRERLYAMSLSIAAGTSQIQRNIVGERVLGLPKER